MNSGPAQRMKRAAGKVGETSLEAATLSIVNGQDPFEAMGYAAGAQAAANVGLLGITSKKGFKRLAGAAAATTAMLQFFENAPAGRDDVIATGMEKSLDKVQWGILIGTASALAGGGRFRGRRVFEDMPMLTDGMLTIPRGALISLFNDWQRDRSGRMKSVTEELMVRPDTFNEGERRRLGRAMRSERVSLLNEIDRMSKNPKFASKLHQINRRKLPPLAR